MDSSESISLLNQLILPNVELKNYSNPRDYLKWFLEKCYGFFTPAEQFDFANVHYYSLNSNSPEDFLNGRLIGIPCLFSTKGLSKDRSLQLRDILSFWDNIETLVLCISHKERQINYSSISIYFLMFR